MGSRRRVFDTGNVEQAIAELYRSQQWYDLPLLNSGSDSATNDITELLSFLLNAAAAV